MTSVSGQISKKGHPRPIYNVLRQILAFRRAFVWNLSEYTNTRLMTATDNTESGHRMAKSMKQHLAFQLY